MKFKFEYSVNDIKYYSYNNELYLGLGRTQPNDKSKVSRLFMAKEYATSYDEWKAKQDLKAMLR